MNSNQLLQSALRRDFLTAAEGKFLFETVPASELMYVANELRQQVKPGNKVTWIIFPAQWDPKLGIHVT